MLFTLKRMDHLNHYWCWQICWNLYWSFPNFQCQEFWVPEPPLEPRKELQPVVQQPRPRNCKLKSNIFVRGRQIDINGRQTNNKYCWTQPFPKWPQFCKLDLQIGSIPNLQNSMDFFPIFTLIEICETGLQKFQLVMANKW